MTSMLVLKNIETPVRLTKKVSFDDLGACTKQLFAAAKVIDDKARKKYNTYEIFFPKLRRSAEG